MRVEIHKMSCNIVLLCRYNEKDPFDSIVLSKPNAFTNRIVGKAKLKKKCAHRNNHISYVLRCIRFTKICRRARQMRFRQRKNPPDEGASIGKSYAFGVVVVFFFLVLSGCFQCCFGIPFVNHLLRKCSMPPLNLCRRLGNWRSSTSPSAPFDEKVLYSECDLDAHFAIVPNSTKLNNFRFFSRSCEVHWHTTA